MKRGMMLLILLVCCIALCAHAEELSNDNYKYTITNGEVTITRYLGAGGSVTIPGYIDGLPVTTIGEAAFRHLSSKKITHVTIPDTVTVIEDYAFCEMWTLASVSLPRHLTSIGVSAFYNNQLTNVTIPESVTSLGRTAFYANKKLEKLTLPANITDLGTEIVNASVPVYCDMHSVTAKNLTDHSFADPDAPHLFLQYKADGTELAVVKYTGAHSNVHIPEGVTEIGREAFHAAIYMQSISIPNSVTTIGAVAFESCRNLKSVTIPDSVTDIGGSAFLGCTQLRTVKLPAGDVTYGSNLFGDCTSLTSIELPVGNTAIGDSMFRGCTALSSVKIPTSVTSIGHYAFMSCSSLKEITLLDHITNIGRDAFVYVDKVVITCYQGSCADEWAAAYGVKVKYIAPARLPGDADGDGSVSIMDALAILQHDVGWDVQLNAANADVDGDSTVSIMDALLILQHDVGWDVTLK